MSSKMPKVGQNMSENASFGLFSTLSGRFMTHMGDQEIQSISMMLLDNLEEFSLSVNMLPMRAKNRIG